MRLDKATEIIMKHIFQFGGLSMRYQAYALAVLATATAAVAQHNKLTDAEVAAGYQLLFDGTSFNNTNWVTYLQGDTTGTNLESAWKVYPADSAFGKETAPRDIRTRKTFKDFIVEFDFKTTGNSGFYYRTTTDYGFGWGTGVEYAIENNTSLKPWIVSGAAYELIAPSVTNYAGENKWNKAKIIAIADSVEHWMNGVKVVAFKYWDAQWTKALQGQLPYLNGERSKWNTFPTFCRPKGKTTGYITQGYFGLQGDHAGATKFRNFKVAPLTAWPGTVGIGNAHSGDAGIRATLLSRIQVRGTGMGSSLSLDFAKPYEVSIFDISGRSQIAKINANEPKVLNLDKATFHSGLFLVRVKVAGITLDKKISL